MRLATKTNRKLTKGGVQKETETEKDLRSGDVDGANVYGNGGCIVDICLIAEQPEIPMRVERGVLSII